MPTDNARSTIAALTDATRPGAPVVQVIVDEMI